MRSLNQKINSNKTKHLLVFLKKLQTIDSIYFRGKSHFKEDGTQNYLVFQSMYRYFKRFAGVGSGSYIYFQKSKGLSDENITAPTRTSIHNSLNSQLTYLCNKTRAEFKGSCLKRDKITYDHEKIVNIYIVYEKKNYDISSYPTLENCLCGAAALTKYTNIAKYKYAVYGIGFDRKAFFHTLVVELVEM